MKLEKVLAELGLAKNKGNVYLAALQVGTGTVQQIAKKARLPRTTVHEILQQLAGLGLVSFVFKGKSRIYTATHPEKLESILKGYERHLNIALPEFMSIYRTTGKKPLVRFYEGSEGVKTVLEETLNPKDPTFRFILSVQDLFKTVGKKYMDGYVSRRIALGIRIKVVRSMVKDVPGVWPSSHRENREVHYASEGMIFPMTFCIYDKKVAVISSQSENFAMVIESTEFYQVMKAMHEVLWQTSRVGKYID
jgi:HTH-type transcriptional regulator, sugar sensing transcriptional regulator